MAFFIKQDMLVLGGFVRDVMADNEERRNFRVFGPDETMSKASGGKYIRTMSAFLLATWSKKPGSWCVKPLWSCCQTCEEST